MKIKSKILHLNNGGRSEEMMRARNKGFSLVELIVAIAIMIVFVAVAIISTSVIDTSRVKEVERGIDDYANMARKKSMSVSAMEWYMELTTVDGEYVTRLCRVDEVIENGTPSPVITVVDMATYNNKVKVIFNDGVTSHNIDNTQPLKIYFDSATGKVSKITVNEIDVSEHGGGIGRVMIDTETYDATLKFFYNTGKIERE